MHLYLIEQVAKERHADLLRQASGGLGAHRGRHRRRPSIAARLRGSRAKPAEHAPVRLAEPREKMLT
jgi:hypothetical protein